MARAPPASMSFYLTNGADKPPIVHSLFEDTTETWQYVVADPSTNSCFVLDPVRDHTTEENNLATSGADAILNLIQSHGYKVDHIFETNSSHNPSRSASWYLRMRLSESQGYAPRLCSGGTVSAMQRLFARKYGDRNRFSTTLDADYADSESVTIGRMRVTVLHIPGYHSEDGRAYVVGKNLFGAHSIATLGGNERKDETLDQLQMDKEASHRLWTSMQRILSFPEETCVYFDHGAHITGYQSESFVTIGYCRSINPYVGLGPQEFLVRREGERRERRQRIEAPTTKSKKGNKRTENKANSLRSASSDNT